MSCFEDNGQGSANLLLGEGIDESVTAEGTGFLGNTMIAFDSVWSIKSLERVQVHGKGNASRALGRSLTSPDHWEWNSQSKQRRGVLPRAV